MDLDVRLTVLGSLNMDISVAVPNLPAPGETVLGGSAVIAPGGKGANQAVAAARLAAGPGMRVRMVGCVGDDDFGRSLRGALTAEGVDDQAVRTVPGVPTGIAMITVDEAGENIITVAPGANREVGAPEVAAAGRPAPVPSAPVPGVPVPSPPVPGVPVPGVPVPGVPVPGVPVPGVPVPGVPVPGVPVPSAPVPSVLVISAEVPVPAIRAALTVPGARPLTVLNLAPAPPAAEAAGLLAARPDWLVVNESEAAAVLGRPVAGLAEAARAAVDLVTAGARNAVVTAGAAGAAFRAASDNPAPRTIAAFSVRAVDTVGAGDTFVAALALTLAAGLPPEEAVTAASAAAATAATRPGTQSGMPRPDDVRQSTGYAWPFPVVE